LTGSSQVIVSAQKTVESCGAICHSGRYTYYCAEEPTSIVPATCAALIVEPGVEQGVQMEYYSLAACEAEYLSLSVWTWYRIYHGGAMLVGILIDNKKRRR